MLLRKLWNIRDFSYRVLFSYLELLGGIVVSKIYNPSGYLHGLGIIKLSNEENGSRYLFQWFGMFSI